MKQASFGLYFGAVFIGNIFYFFAWSYTIELLGARVPGMLHAVLLYVAPFFLSAIGALILKRAGILPLEKLWHYGVVLVLGVLGWYGGITVAVAVSCIATKDCL